MSRRGHTRLCERCKFAFDSTLSQCPSCRKWNGLEEQGSEDETVLLSDAAVAPIQRIRSGPWDPCFGGGTPSDPDRGIVITSTVLIAGAPGAGKSTLALQLGNGICLSTGREIMYIGAEESPAEIKARAVRLQLCQLNRMRVFPMGSNADFLATLTNRRPAAIILDSLPGLEPDPEAAAELCKILKSVAVDLQAPFFIIDHVTKDGDFAGLMKLQHEVDTTLTLFSIVPDDAKETVRELSVMKNRFGRTDVTVYLDMTATGLVEISEEEVDIRAAKLDSEEEEEDEEDGEDEEEDEEDEEDEKKARKRTKSDV